MSTLANLSPGAADPAPVMPHEPHLTPAEAETLPAKLQLRFAAWLRVSGEFDRAAEMLESFERQFGESAALLDERAALALARRDEAAVRHAWQVRLAAFPAPSAKASFARALIELGAIEEAAAIATDLQAEHGELMTVRSLVAEVALQLGDLAAAHDYFAPQLQTEQVNVAAALTVARIALLGGDPDDARAKLDRALADLETLTSAQFATAGGLADLLGQPARSQFLRQRMARRELARSATLASEIDAALGRSHGEKTAPPSLDNHLSAADGGAPLPAQPTEPPGTEGAVPIAAEEPVADPRVLPALRQVFGHAALLPGQAAIINRALAGTDTLAILPTGAGKSLTFQLPALLLPEVTLVISPLIALMKDQLEGLPEPLRARALLVNSTLTPDEQRRALEQIAAGEAKLVYAAPERLRQPNFLRALQRSGVSLVVVDEAHCISLWGHDFRPDYLSIPAALPELGNPPLLAMTATASPETAASLSGSFRRTLDVVRTSAFRPNLFYAAERLGSKEEKARRVIALCRELPGAGIVYVSSRRDADNLAGVLNDHGVRAVSYHAGLEPRLRTANQDRFMSGAARVVVATVAFGMGVDKRDVRFIIHFSPSTSLEAYAQESGRAGRDGESSRCVLLYSASDRATQTRLANRDAMDLDTLRQVYTGIKRHAVGSWAIFNPSRIVLQTGPTDDPDELLDPRIGIGLLEESKLLERHPNAPVTWTLSRRPGEALESDVGSEDADLWQRFAAWAGLNQIAGDRLTVQTAAACDALGISPETLAGLLDVVPGWEAREGDRLTCLRLLPAGENAGPRLQRVIQEAANRARARVNRMMTYAAGHRCRHAELAAHLGERLPPCGVACDVCTHEPADAEPSGQPDGPPAKRSHATASDALAVLNAVRTAPFSVGKTGLTRLLEGSIQSRIQGDRSPSFGALGELRKARIDDLIDRLVDDGFLIRDLSHEFKLIRLTPQGAGATRDDLAAYDAEPPSPEPTRLAPAQLGELDLSPEEGAILGSLQAWRRERAARDVVPAYVVAHNTTLLEIARRRPGSLAALAEIKGFGQSRVEKYGAEIVATVEAATNVPNIE